MSPGFPEARGGCVKRWSCVSLFTGKSARFALRRFTVSQRRATDVGGAGEAKEAAVLLCQEVSGVPTSTVLRRLFTEKSQEFARGRGEAQPGRSHGRWVAPARSVRSACCPWLAGAESALEVVLRRGKAPRQEEPCSCSARSRLSVVGPKQPLCCHFFGGGNIEENFRRKWKAPISMMGASTFPCQTSSSFSLNFTHFHPLQRPNNNS